MTVLLYPQKKIVDGNEFMQRILSCEIYCFLYYDQDENSAAELIIESETRNKVNLGKY